MKKANLTTSITKTFNDVLFKVKKYSPEILIVAGVAGSITSTVLACQATTKLSGILEKTNEDIELIHSSVDNKNLSEEYTEEDCKKDLTIVYVKTSIEIAKLYAPSITLGIISMTSIIKSNDILHKRNVALTAAYSAVNKSFKGYRDRVIERFGETVDKELKYNIKAKTFTETVIDEETGEEKTIEKTVNIMGKKAYSPYARFFDASCFHYEKDSEYNLMFLTSEQNYANDILKVRGRLFLNDVYKRLGIPESKEGQVVGWVYDEKNPKNFIDFGIYEGSLEANRDFVNGYEPVILLDFNVQGNIWESMEDNVCDELCFH